MKCTGECLHCTSQVLQFHIWEAEPSIQASYMVGLETTEQRNQSPAQIAARQKKTLKLALAFPWIKNCLTVTKSLKVGCLPYAVGKQPSIPLIDLRRTWTLNWWWWWWWWRTISLPRWCHICHESDGACGNRSPGLSPGRQDS